jgi:glycosyltransferase involved in cell wall biosynthesis
MKISVLTPDLSNNSLGRAWLLAKILQRRFEVEIIGPMFGSAVWEPVQSEFSYKGVKGCLFPRFVPEIYKMVKKTKGDVVYAHKPVFSSFAIGLIKKHLGKRPLVLDIDDWEAPLRLKYHGKKNVLYPNSYWSTLLHERSACLADEITVSNRFLQEKFGGTIVHHARDTERLDPSKYDGMRLKEKHGVAGKKVVTFLGTPRSHKGLEDLIRAFALLQDKQLVLMIVGLDKSGYAQDTQNMMRGLLPTEQILAFGMQPIQDVPKFLSFTDLVVIPQRKTSESIGQTPAKVFDAMAMAKPIIATNVSDLPEILDGCGWIVDAENPVQLAQSIREVLANPDKAQYTGKKARDKCIKQYSYDAAEKILLEIFDKY